MKEKALKGLETKQPRRGPRPGHPSGLQRTQRGLTRARILQATQALLVHNGFADLSIDDVLKAAPVSRSTFYRHFKSKLDIIFALYDIYFPQSLARFEKLRFIDNNEEHIILWVWENIEGYRSSGALAHVFLELAVTNREFHERLRIDRQKLINHLATILPAFASTQGSCAVALQRWVRADILLIQINRICSEIALHEDLPHEAFYIRQTALDILSFMQSAAS